MNSRENNAKHPKRGGRSGRGDRGGHGGNKFNKFQGSHHQKPWKHNNHSQNWDQTHWSNRRSSEGHRKHYSHRPRFYGYNNDYSNSPVIGAQLGREPEEDGPPLPGSEAERSNKIELDKKRIREALSSATEVNNPLNFQNSGTESGSKEKSTTSRKLNVPLSELRLTADDLMEIGSVTGKLMESNDVEEVLDNVLYTSQRVHPADNYKASNNKPQIRGWKTFQIPTEANLPLASTSNNVPNPCENNKGERILGDVVPSNETRIVEPKNVNNSDTDRIGRLYKSFLKARYFKFKFKLSNQEPMKEKVQNPFLAATVTELQNISNKEDKEKQAKKTNVDEEEPAMPLPIQIKIEKTDTNEKQTGAESREELEANEFLKEYSHLLNPDFEIPIETLEMLGLGHLCEEYPLVDKPDNQTKHHGTSGNAQNKPETLLRVKSLSTLNSTPFIDNLSDQSSRRNQNFTSSPSISRENASPNQPFSSISRQSASPNPSFSSTPMRKASSNPSLPNPENRNNANSSANLSTELNVEEVLSEVLENILKKRSQSSAGRKTSEKNSTVAEKQLNAQLGESSHYGNNPSPSIDNTGVMRNGQPNEVCCQAKNQLLDVSDKMLKMFLIDKQIQELMEEKLALYNELMSTKEIASTFFNSWAKDKQVTGVTHQTSSQQNMNVNRSRPNEQTENVQVRITPDTNSPSLGITRDNNSPSLGLTSDINKPPLDQNGLNSLLNNVESVKQYLMSFQTKAIADAASTFKQSLTEIKKEAMAHPEISDEASVSTSIHSDSEKVQKNKKRKKKTAKKNSDGEKRIRKDVDETELTSDQNKSGSSKTSNTVNLNSFDEIVEINSEDDEKFEDLYETKFEPSKLKTSSKETNNELKIKKKPLKFADQDVTVLCLKISESLEVCVAGCRDGQLLIYCLSTGKLKGKLIGHKESITCLWLFQSKGLVISGSTDCTLRCFHLKARTELYTVNVGCVVQCMDLKYGLLFVGTKTGLLYTYSVKENLYLVDEPLSLTDSSILAVRAAKEGVRNILIVAARGQQITVRDASSGLLLRTFNWCDTVYCLEFAGESPIVYCGTRTKSVVAVDFINGEEKFKCDAGRGVSQICFAHNLMFTACYDGKVYVYDHKKRNLVTRINVSNGMLLSLSVYNNQIIVASTRNEFLAVPFPQDLLKYLNWEEKA